MGGFNLQEMLAQARQQAEKLQEKMQQVTIEASSGGGSVTVRMTGQKQLLSVVIEPEVVKSGDIEMLQDLVTAAVNEASRKVDEALKSSSGRHVRGDGAAGDVKGARECASTGSFGSRSQQELKGHGFSRAARVWRVWALAPEGSRTSRKNEVPQWLKPKC